MTPYLEPCCLRLSANMSYENAAQEIAFLTGISVSVSTQQRLVQGYGLTTPVVTAESPMTELAVDGAKFGSGLPKESHPVGEIIRAL